MREWIKMAPAFVLAKGETMSLRPRGRACRITCLAGRLWATRSGCRSDTVLIAGEEMAYTGGGHVVVEALRTATVRVDMRMRARVKPRLLFPQPAL